MSHRSRWLAAMLLATTLTGASMAPATAAEVSQAPARQRLTVEPKMNFIPNTSVYYQRNAPGYDLYRYANRWYLVEDGRWYRARSWRGPFVSVPFSAVPDEIVNLPEGYRRYWRSEGIFDIEIPEGSFASTRSFAEKPDMTRITNAGVSYARDVSGFDLYRFRSTWYLVESGVWFRSDSWKGPFLSMPAREVPREVRSVPASYRRHWIAPAAYRGEAYWASGLMFPTQPAMSLIPNTGVYYLPLEVGYGLYRYGNTWYLVDQGIWYSARTWRGPYVRVDTGRVPSAVLTIPFEYRKDWPAASFD